MHPPSRQNTTSSGLFGGYKALFATPHRFTFNGKESDSEVKGEGNQQDYGMRIYDNRLGRFLSVDPLMKSYPWYTPFQFAGNNPIKFIDLDGLEEANPAKPGENKNGVQTSAIDNTRAGYTNQYYLQRYYTPPPAPLPPDPGTIRQDGVLGNPQFQQFKWQVDHGVINYTLPVDFTKKLIKGEEITATDIGIEVAGVIPFGKIFGKFGKVISKTQFTEGAFKELANFFKMNENQTIEVIRKRLSSTIDSANKRIATHKEWIADPTIKYGNDWNDFSEERKLNVIHHWQQDIKRAEAQKEVSKAALEEIK